MARVISFSQEMMVRELALYSIVARRVAPKKTFFGGLGGNFSVNGFPK